MADDALITKINRLIPALVVVYSIKTGQYIYVNDGLESILGFKKEVLLKKGLPYATSLVHPDDLPLIAEQSQKAVKKANSQKNTHTDHMPLTFEYRMRHKNGSWKWLHSDGIIFDRDTKGRVEYVMNISIDITDRKQAELEEKRKRDQAEQEKNLYHQNQLRLVKLRADVAEVLRKGGSLEEILEKSLAAVVKNLPATFARLWLLDSAKQLLTLAMSSGDYPPNSTIKRTVKVGEFAVGLVAKQNKAYIANDLDKRTLHLLQNSSWSKNKKIKAFAGYPLFFKNQTIGVIAAFSSNDFSENTLISLANVADVLAQEITRKKIEDQLIQSQERYLAFMQQSSEGIWRIELEKPVSTHLAMEKQIDQFYKYAYMAECNDAMAKMYGLKKANELIGARLGDLLIRDDPNNIIYLENFITSSYNLINAESAEVDSEGKRKYFDNNLIGIVENGFLIRAWGIQRDITKQKKAEEEMKKMARQKDEFIAIASHELKTPLTSLKAYTQVLEQQFTKHGDPKSAVILHKMDLQFNRLMILISDLLDISKMEAGKLQFEIKRFKINTLIKEITEQMQRTTQKHHLKTKLEDNFQVIGDRNRLGQVLINFISNAIKYSPENKQILIKTHLKNQQLIVSVHDSGIGIAKNDQPHIFERFYRSKSQKKQSFPGLGLGLYICQEIVKRHGGKVGVESKIGHGSTFFFSLPLKNNRMIQYK